MSHSCSSFVIGIGGGYTLDPRHIWIDVDEFETLAKRGFDALRELDLVAAQRDLQRAVDLYRGEFLADELYADWAHEERSSLHGLATRAFRALAVLAHERDDADAALACLKRLRELEPYDDSANRDYIAALRSVGRLSDARRCFLAFSERLKREFGETPSFDLKSRDSGPPLRG